LKGSHPQLDIALEILPQVLIDGIVLGFMYALIALGYTMVYGVLEFINFAHSEIFVLGAFVGVELLLLLQSAGALGTLHPAFALLLVMIAATVISGLAAMALERVAYRPLQGAPRLVALISAIGASFFLQDGLRLFESLWRNTFYLNYPSLEFLDHNVTLSATLVVPVKSILVIVTALLMLVGLYLFVNRTRVGTAIRAVAQDPDTASLMGIAVNRIVALTFFVGGAMGGLAGVLFGLHYSLVNPYSGFIPGMKAFTAAVLGGIGNIPGAMLGGMVLGLLEAFAASYLSLLTDGAFGAEYKDVVAFLVLIVILVFRPKGLLGEKVREARA
jgi:branched-chain amino acid transport system permease protein